MANESNDLIVMQGCYSYVLDQTKGFISIISGPHKTSLSNTDQIVRFVNGKFEPVSKSEAVQSNILVRKGQYAVLENPSKDGKHPESGRSEVAPALRFGQIENISGPICFGLYPGQQCKVIDAHIMKTNQYVIVRVYDEDEARNNWNTQIIRLANVTESLEVSQVKVDAKKDQKPGILGIQPEDITIGQMFIIKGTEVSFYIPSGGFEVLVDENGKYVRDAVTLERLEYSILLNEGGEKSYVRGPTVVFPTANEIFITGQGGVRKFKAVELTETSGLYIQVIADYEENGTKHTAGDELFITGKQQPIYYPRAEHSIITYAGKDGNSLHKYHAIAIPTGEARYVLNRSTGKIRTVKGPAMFLPDPRTEVIVKRVLSEKECGLYFPGNNKVAQLNATLRDASTIATTSYVAVSHGGTGVYPQGHATIGASACFAGNVASPGYEAQARQAAGASQFGDSISRNTSYTPPRTITLDNKHESLNIDVWNGYAVQVVNKAGERKVVVGPQTIILEYDEYLEQFSLSTGNPKSDANRVTDVFLKISENSISDTIRCKTKDMIDVRLSLRLQTHFDVNHQDNWFSIDNHVQLLVDDLRSEISNHVRTISAQELYLNAAEIISQLILNQDEPSIEYLVLENGLTVTQVDLQQLVFEDSNISKMLQACEQESLTNTINLTNQQRKLDLALKVEEINRQVEECKIKTLENKRQLEHELEIAALAKQREIQEKQAETRRLMLEKAKAAEEISIATKQAQLEYETSVQNLALDKIAKEQALTVEATKAESEAVVARMNAVQPGLVEALSALSFTSAFENMAEHLSPLSIVRGESLGCTLEGIFSGTPFMKILDNANNMIGAGSSKAEKGAKK